MGEVTKLYCELCKAEITPPTFSKPEESGEIHYFFCLSQESGDTVVSFDTEICESCNDKLTTWATIKQKAAATAWKTEPPATITVKMPTI